jgi:hypothetical protein
MTLLHGTDISPVVELIIDWYPCPGRLRFDASSGAHEGAHTSVWWNELDYNLPIA